ncbi:hypothetical protein KF728_20985 [Candidatus Obscuribacterales bacterium]|nr:hypothetical protein [Candidatus Obscuribacterales bacterium]MBX3152645.1 hypothetical protein [Candidatus Obscuribacterales bacterium]
MATSPSTLAKATVTSGERAIQRVGSATNVSPEGRAFNLINVARSVLSGADIEQITQDQSLYKVEPTYALRNSYGDNLLWDFWIGSFVEEEMSKARGGPNNRLPTKDQLCFADRATQLAVKLLKEAPASPTKLQICFVASLQFKRIGNTQGAQGCDEFIQQSVKNCEDEMRASPEAIIEAVSVLNSMAYRLAPVPIPSGTLASIERKDLGQSITEDAARKSEELRLRAMKLADRLPSDNHVRRMVHRDLVFFYRHFDRQNLAEEQKQILFELVGVSDDKILFPVSQFCGRALWWTAATGQIAALCGMG